MVEDILTRLKHVSLLTAEEEVRFACAAAEHKRIETARLSLVDELGRKPTADEVAAVTGHPSGAEVKRAVRTGKAARACMIEANMRLVVSVASRYKGRGLTLADLVHEGTAGLIRGIDKYDATKGYKLSTYVTWWIRQAITRAICEQSRCIRLPTHVYETLRRIAAAKRELREELDSLEPTVEQVAARVDLPPAKVEAVLRAAKTPVSIDMSADGRDSNDRDDADLVDYLATGDLIDGVGGGPDDVDAAKLEELRQGVEAMLSTLPPRERNVLRMRYGLDAADGRAMTLIDLSSAYGVTRERIRQIELKALRKLRHPSSLAVLETYLRATEGQAS